MQPRARAHLPTVGQVRPTPKNATRPEPHHPLLEGSNNDPRLYPSATRDRRDPVGALEHRAERRRRFVHQTHQALGSGCAAIAYDVPVRKTKPDGDLRRQGPTPGMTADSLWRLSCGSASAPAGSAHRSRHRPGPVMRPNLAGGSTARGELAPIGGDFPGMVRAAPAIRSKGRSRLRIPR